MSNSTLHITNGSSLTNYLKELNFEGDLITWHEMLCEGPTIKNIDTPEFISIRKKFIEQTYHLDYKESAFIATLNALNQLENYNEIILWFEYDLFCHINLIAVISLLKQKYVKAPLYLVCSGNVKGEKDLKGLPELSPKQLKFHYEKKIKLTENDIALAQNAWSIYCGQDHHLLKALIAQPSNYKYMGMCLKAHIQRFSNSQTGLNGLEHNIINLVNTHPIKSKKHLLRYALRNQGYYGFGDIQLERIINRLTPFFYITNESLTLNEKGVQALNKSQNFIEEIDTNHTFGGANRAHFLFCEIDHKLIAIH